MKTKAIVIICKDIEPEILKFYSQFKSKNYDIIFISPQKNKLINKPDGIIFLEDEVFISKKSFLNKAKIRPFWYYQQFLKYQVVLKLNYDQIHIIDGDSYLNPILFFNHNPRYTDLKINIGYRKGLKSFKLNDTKRNFITNEMSFKKDELKKMISLFGFNEKNYIEKILENISDKNWFSEYQTYALYKCQYLKMKADLIKVFRRKDLIFNPLKSRFGKHYMLVSYEHSHKKDLIRVIVANIYYLIGKNLG